MGQTACVCSRGFLYLVASLITTFRQAVQGQEEALVGAAVSRPVPSLLHHGAIFLKHRAVPDPEEANCCRCALGLWWSESFLEPQSRGGL